MGDRKAIVGMVLVVSALFVCGVDFAQASPLWGDLKPGAFPVGFDSQFQTDSSRPYKPKTDYSGNPLPGDRSRPIQVSFWYPAVASSQPALTFADYVALTANEERGGEVTSQDRDAALGSFLKSRWAQGADETKLKEVLNMKMAAVRKADAAKGRFPLVLIAHSSGMSYPYGNSVLAEYLAGHGYVVATSPAVGASSRRLSFDSIGVMAATQDLQFLISAMHKQPNVDPDKLAVIGFSFGALGGSLLAMHNTDMDAFVSLDGSQGNRFGYSVLFQNPLYEPVRVTIPVLHITSQETSPNISTTFFKALKYSSVTTVKIRGTTTEFSSLGAIAAHVPKFGGETETDPKLSHHAALTYVRAFLDASVKKDAKAVAFLAGSPESNGFLKDLVVADTSKGFPKPPSEAEFVEIIQSKGVSPAIETFRKIRTLDPEFRVFEPETLNEVADQMIQDKKVKDAIELMKMNLEAFPGDWEVYDYLGRAYMADGNNPMAIENFTKSLDLNPDNSHAQEMLKKLGQS